VLKTLHHIAIIASDYDVSKKFYTEVLGLKVIREMYRKDRDSYKLDLALDGKYVIELFSFPDPPKRKSYPEAAGLRHLAFGVERVDEVRNTLLEKNVEVEEIRTDALTGKKFCFFNDPDGQPLELYEM